MSNTTISIKKSATPSATPSNLANGELAINFADGKLFYKNTTGQIVSFTSGTNSFGTVNANGTLIIADTTGDILTLEAGSNIAITADAINDKITISASGSGGGTLTTFTSNVGDGSANTFNVSHQLNSYWLLTSVRELSTGDIVYPDLRQTTANNLVISFVDNPTSNQYTLLIAKVG